MIACTPLAFFPFLSNLSFIYSTYEGAIGQPKQTTSLCDLQLRLLRVGSTWLITRVVGTEYIFYCKRAILFLSSSKILTPHPPLRPASLSSPLQQRRGYTLAGRRGGWGVNILEGEKQARGQGPARLQPDLARSSLIFQWKWTRPDLKLAIRRREF